MIARSVRHSGLPASPVGFDRRYTPIAARDQVAVWIAALAPILGIGFVTFTTTLLGV